MSQEIKDRLEYLREQIENECISYGEIVELQSLAEYIDEDDVVLAEWAGISEDDWQNPKHCDQHTHFNFTCLKCDDANAK